MATTIVSVSRQPRIRAKYLLFALVGLMFTYVLQHNESFVLNMSHPIWNHYQPFKWYLLPHGLAGACALVLGPMQFSDRLRQKYAKLHRVAGRIYVAGALIASPLGFYIQFSQERLGAPRSFTMAGFTHGTLWTLTTAIAFYFILKGKVQQHRQWMTRSFVVGPMVFMSARTILGISGLETRGPATIELVVWMCVAFSIPVADIILQAQEQLRSRAANSSKAMAASR